MVQEKCQTGALACLRIPQHRQITIRVAKRQNRPPADVQGDVLGLHLAVIEGIEFGERRRLGGISKRGDVYLRTLLVHGARSALLAAHRQQRTGHPLDHLRLWALQCERQRGHNVATVALANRLARIVWATWKHGRAFDGNWGCTAQ